jgi:hypothetical protein
MSLIFARSPRAPKMTIAHGSAALGMAGSVRIEASLIQFGAHFVLHFEDRAEKHARDAICLMSLAPEAIVCRLSQWEHF